MNRISARLIALLTTASCGAACLAQDAADEKPVFRFAGGEQVQIQLFGEELSEAVLQASTNYTPQLVTADGFISAPAAGTVNIKGMTLQDATSAVVEKVKAVQKLKTPRISIAVLSMPPRWVYVQGEVSKPQQLEIPKDRLLLHLASVLAAAGGPTQDADLMRVQIIHGERKADTPVEEIVDMSYAVTGRMPRGPALTAGDIVVVPLAESFSVTGEVNKAGLFGRGDSKVKSGKPIRLSDALAAAGGLKPSADMKAVKLLRRVGPTEEPKLLTFDVDAALNKADASQDPIVRDGDRILVASNDGYLLLGRVKTPGVYYAPGAGGVPLTITRLIALGGGFDIYAKKSSVTVVRKDKPGHTMAVDVKAIIEEGKLDKDLQLSPGDVVFVGESAL